MGLFAALAPSPVPISDLAVILGTGTELDEQARHSLDLSIDLALITPTTDGRGLVMHESVAQVLRDRAWPTGEDGGWVAHAADRVADLLPPLEQAKERRVETITRIIQLRNLWDLGVLVCLKVPNGCPQIVLELLEEPMARATRHLIAAGDLRLAQEITEVVVDDVGEILGAGHPSIAAFRTHVSGEPADHSDSPTELAPA